MEDIKDFESFYTSRLQPFLGDLESQSNDAGKWSTAGIASVILAIVCFIIGENFAAILFIILVIVSVYKYTNKKEVFTDNYKRTVIKEIINYLNPGTEYSPSKVISSKDYKKSGLFMRRFNDYSGGDLMKGIYKNVTFYCSELHTQYIPEDSESSQISVFEGLFFAAPLSNIFKGNTYVWPIDDEQLPQSRADEHFKRVMPLPKVYHIKMNYPFFENHFCIYCTDSSEARLILDKEMMDRMVYFKKQINRDIRYSFVEGVCYVAIAIDENLLEPSISNPGSKEYIKEYFFSILLIFSIINQLNLSRLI